MIDFAIIGFQKCGTTSARRWLRDHPEVAVPADERAPCMPMPWGGPPDPGSLDHFLASIYDQPTGVRCGPVSPLYTMGDVPANAAALADHNPEMQIICFTREPVQRAFSAWRMAHIAGHDPRAFEEAISSCILEGPDLSPEGWITQSYIAAGEYERTIAAYEQTGLSVTALPMGDMEGLARTLGIAAREPFPHENHNEAMPVEAALAAPPEDDLIASLEEALA